jgi:hypothetical protein
MATAVVLAHTRAFAMQALRVPACRSTNLAFTMELHHVAALIPANSQTDHSLEPSLGNFPCLVLGVPEWLSGLIVA